MQVGIDVSRFDEAGTDARFYVQPDTAFNTHHFFTGKRSNFQQSSRIYSLTWQPTEIEFSSDNGESFIYSTQRSLDAGQPDYNQCLPANVEIRLGLWNLYGTNPPVDMNDDQVAEVVIDNFRYQPSGLQHVSDGSTCSLDCHCGPSSSCYGNVCTKVMKHHQNNNSSFTQFEASPVETNTISSGQLIAGLMVASCCISALVILTYHLLKKTRHRGAEEIVIFDLSPGFVKGWLPV